MPTWLTHAVVPPHTMFSFTFTNDCPLLELQAYVPCPHGLPLQQPLDVWELSVLKGRRAPVGAHVAEQTPP